ASSGPYGAELNRDHAFFNLAEVLLYAEEVRDGPVELEFHNLPPNWKIATPLANRGHVFSAANYDQLVDSPVEISEFREQDFSAVCGQYRVIVDDHGGRTARADTEAIFDRLLPGLRRIVSSAVDWMNDCPFAQYMFVYHFSDAAGGGGMEHSSSTAISLPGKDLDTRPQEVFSITAHEFFHLWNVKRIRPQSLEPVDYTRENYSRALWFSEGVDSTVANYLRLRAGLLDEKVYLEHLSEQITQLENRSARRRQSAEESSLQAWLEKYPYYGLPERSISYYNKGELLGVLLDLWLRHATDDRVSLRELFRWMNDHYAKQGKFFADSQGVQDAAETLSQGALSDFFARYVSGVDEIPWNQFFSIVGLEVVPSAVASSAVGFAAVQKFDQPPVVVTVDSNSPAERAGLKSGDRIVQINGQAAGQNFDADLARLPPASSLRLVIERAGVENRLEFKVGRENRTIFHLTDVRAVTREEKARRSAWLFGTVAP
ncbi:MAG: M61 family metallopeptidase, partial [Acidobacteria bacterium]|nr:M61 family metallopeptidase [Acidobacteriota bacterium]